MKSGREATSECNIISHFFLLGCLGFFTTGEVWAVNMTVPHTVITGTVGGEAVLSVTFSSFSVDPPVIKWLLRREKSITVVQSIGTDIIGTLRPEYRDRILVFENGTLLLHNLRLSDEGVYDVEVSITDDTFPGEGSITLTVDEAISKPYVYVESASVLELSQNIVLNCSHDNGTRTRYKWFKGGKPQTNETRFVLSHDQKFLTITRVLMVDDDLYSCTVENPVGSVSSVPVRLSVYRRSSVYIILSTGGIFLLVTLLTVCACWSPSKKAKHGRRKPPSGKYDQCLHPAVKHRETAPPRPKEHNGVHAVTSLYILQQKDPSVDSLSLNSIGSPEYEEPPRYTSRPRYSGSPPHLNGSPVRSSSKFV